MEVIEDEYEATNAELNSVGGCGLIPFVFGLIALAGCLYWLFS